MKLDRELQSVLLDLATAERVQIAGPVEQTTPEQKELEALEKKLQRTREAAGSAQMAVDDMETEILRIQEDERKLRRRERDDREQLKAATDPELRKDLEHDRYTAKSRINDLLYELKEAHDEIHALRNNRDVHGAQVDELTRQVEVARRAAEAANSAARDVDPAERIRDLRSQLPDDVLTAYEEQKDENDIGAAGFNGRSCGGCHIVLPPADRAKINKTAADELPQCTNCGTYLVRETVA
ncbi:hypothetical protein C3B44_03320 [Corynebacterium yudongzhengii]|uniref:Uncharacterized protein n=1 Tax=Corynebacterium yudongzhengii TaxID=2080740 RepID=A0A2U1T7E1_9CORY|nr:C4-type zinc ribbon domain-containing protein [Corynebacterium yudongzhengii]AWB81503.1 hypothetical protein C3B44_03320 [Corynebacterium yudongzhengii]PWC01926.1 hypothetical protein DF222_04925 [Corynebacterium yudongzhengii]